MHNWNPNTPHTVGLELPNQGASNRRIAGLQQMLITFKALATEPVTSLRVPVGPGTVVTKLTPPARAKFYDSVPDYASLAMNEVEGVICADLGLPGEVLSYQDFPVSSIGGVMNGNQDHRYARNDNLTTGASIGTGTIGDVEQPGDGNWLSDPNGNGHVGSSSFCFNTATFPLDRHVLRVEIGVRSNGPLMATTVRSDPATPTFWRSAPGRVFWESKEFQENLYAIGEMYVDNLSGANEIRRLSPQFVRDFAEGGIRRFLLSTNANLLSGAALIRTRIDHIAMRVYYTTESRQATGWVTKDGRATLRVPTDVRSAADTGASPAPYSKTVNQTQNLLLRQFFPGNVPVPTMVFSAPRIQGTVGFSNDWQVRDTVGSPQTSRPISTTGAPEPAIAAVSLFTALNNDNAISSETQPYSSTGGVFPYSGNTAGEKATTKNFPTGPTNVTLMYALVSDSLGPKNSITFTLGSAPTSGGTTTSVTMTPEEIASFPVVGHSVVSGTGDYGVGLPWSLPTTAVKWRRVRVLFPTPITFSASGGRVSVKALPNEISTAGFTQNYLVGAVFPQTLGGLYGAQALTADYAVPLAATDAGATYNSALASADLQVTFGTIPALPVVTVATVTDQEENFVATESHPTIAWTWSQGTGPAATRFEVERSDSILGVFERIMEPATAGTYADYEARFNTPSTYRVRAVRTDGVESDWAVSAPVTPVLTKCKLAFSSNIDPSINSTYVDAYSGDTTHNFISRDAESVEFRRIYGRDYEVAFRTAPTGGVQFTRNVLLPTSAGERPPQNVNQDLLAMTRNQKVPYICVRDSTSGRWYASVTHNSLMTTRSIGGAAPVAVSALSIVEVSKTPIVSSSGVTATIDTESGGTFGDGLG